MTIQLIDFRARDFRSLANVTIKELPQVVLLYGKNSVGKSNLIQAVDVWFRLLRHFAKLHQTEDEADVRLGTGETLNLGNIATSQNSLGAPYHDLLRYGQSSFELEGRLRLSGEEEEYEYKFGFAVRAQPSSGAVTAEVKETEWPGSRQPGEEPISWTDPTLKVLRRGLRRAWIQIKAERGFQREWLPTSQREGEAAFEGDGSGLKSALFDAANGVHADRRRLYREIFVSLVCDQVLSLPEPLAVVGPDKDLQLLFDEHPVEHLGSGVRQWALIAGMMAMSEAGIVAIEEPELHLSWSAQEDMAKALGSRVKAPGQVPDQLFLSTHSFLMTGAALESTWFEVTLREGSTQIERHDNDEALRARYCVVDVSEEETRPMRLLSPGVVRIDDKIIRHLRAEPGERIFFRLEEDGSVRLDGEKTMRAFLSDPPMDEEHDED